MIHIYKKSLIIIIIIIITIISMTLERIIINIIKSVKPQVVVWGLSLGAVRMLL